MSAQPPTTASATIHAMYHQILVKAVNEAQYTDPPARIPNGLVAAHPDAATILTGIATGPVTVTVQLNTSAPTQPAQGWDEVHEVELATTTGRMKVMGFMDLPPTELPTLTPQGPGRYRLRVHCRGRDLNRDGADREPREAYLLIIWPIKLGPIDPTEDELRSKEESKIPPRAHSPADEPGRPSRNLKHRR